MIDEFSLNLAAGLQCELQDVILLRENARYVGPRFLQIWRGAEIILETQK